MFTLQARFIDSNTAALCELRWQGSVNNPAVNDKWPYFQCKTCKRVFNARTGKMT